MNVTKLEVLFQPFASDDELADMLEMIAREIRSGVPTCHDVWQESISHPDLVGIVSGSWTLTEVEID
jgi:hypothetical protein